MLLCCKDHLVSNVKRNIFAKGLDFGQSDVNHNGLRREANLRMEQRGGQNQSFSKAIDSRWAYKELRRRERAEGLHQHQTSIT